MASAIYLTRSESLNHFQRLGMNGFDCILKLISTTQRTHETLVQCSPNIESDPAEQTFYSSPFDRPTAEPCECGKTSGSISSVQQRWIDKQIGCILRGDFKSVPMKLDPPIPSWSCEPKLDDYLLKPLYIIHPAVQFNIPIETPRCPGCGTHGNLRFRQFSLPRLIECESTIAYAIIAR